MKRQLSGGNTTFMPNKQQKTKRFVFARAMTPPLELPTFTGSADLSSATLPKGFTEAKATWTTQVGHYVPLTDTIMNPDNTRILKVSWPQSKDERPPTFYSERFTRVEKPGATNMGTPQGPHTVAHVLNETILESYHAGKKGQGALDAMRSAFNDLIRPPASAEALVRAIFPNFDSEISTKASGLRAALDAYRQEHGLMIQRLSNATGADLTTKSPIDALHKQMSALINLDPAGTYGWDDDTKAGDDALKGKGEGYAMTRLQNARTAYGNTVDKAERTRQILRMAKEFNGWLLDRPAMMLQEQADAIDEIQTMRMKAFLKNVADKDNVLVQIKNEFSQAEFRDWVLKEKNMRTATDTVAIASAVLEAQKAYEVLQTARSIPATGKIQPPSDFRQTAEVIKFVTALGPEDLKRLKNLG